MKVLAVDYGSRSVGIASGDSSMKVAFPKCVVKNIGDDLVAESILRICENEGYELVVFGMPFCEDGSKGEQYNRVNRFIGLFKTVMNDKGVSLMTKCIDERFSSFEADDYLADFKGKKVRKNVGDRDMIAAKVILDRYFAGLD